MLLDVFVDNERQVRLRGLESAILGILKSASLSYDCTKIILCVNEISAIAHKVCVEYNIPTFIIIKIELKAHVYIFRKNFIIFSTII